MLSKEGGTSRFLHPDSALKSRSGTKGGDHSNPLNLAESQEGMVVDFDLSESKYNTNINETGQIGTPQRQNSNVALSMESGDFGLSESNFSEINKF
jgi:hypothetical protein